MQSEIKEEIVIDSSPETVWKILTEPEYTPKYMYGCIPKSTWKAGDIITWEGVSDKIVYVSGFMKKYEKLKEFSFSVIDPNAPYPHTPENHLDVIYTLSEIESGTKLTVSQGDFLTVADGENRYKDVDNGEGWAGILAQIKELAEK